ncbi:MAG TPA: hypothetical protein VMU00_10550 [Steroidobacteraceae bacterium]|nr:hypothetical protein [Steroidobacteraceae bacterium]
MATRKAPRKSARKAAADAGRLVPVLREAVAVVDRALRDLGRTPGTRRPRSGRAAPRKG